MSWWQWLQRVGAEGLEQGKEQEDKEWDVWNAGGSPREDEEGTSSPGCPPN